MKSVIDLVMGELFIDMIMDGHFVFFFIRFSSGQDSKTIDLSVTIW